MQRQTSGHRRHRSGRWTSKKRGHFSPVGLFACEIISEMSQKYAPSLLTVKCESQHKSLCRSSSKMKRTVVWDVSGLRYMLVLYFGRFAFESYFKAGYTVDISGSQHFNSSFLSDTFFLKMSRSCNCFKMQSLLQTERGNRLWYSLWFCDKSELLCFDVMFTV